MGVTRICTICARGGSKGVPGKNLRLLAGRPLIAWTIEHARASSLFGMIAVSSDCCDIRAAGVEAGADLAVERPAELATDTAGKTSAIRHCLMAAESELGRRADTIVDLDVTSPLRNPDDIRGAVRLLETSGVSNVITGTPARRSPYFNLIELDSAGTARLSKPPRQPILRRQDTPACFDMNASIYVWQRNAFMREPKIFYENTRLYEMPESRSVDIDTEQDFEFVEFLLARRKKEVQA